MATGKTMARRLGCCILVGTAFAVGWPARAQSLELEGLAYDVRVIRYAATGNTAPIEGNEDTLAERQAWLDAIAAALEEASLFFWLPYTSGTVGDAAHGPHPAWCYDRIILRVVGTGPGGAITEWDIILEIGKITWIVAPKSPMYYGTWNDKVKLSLYGYCTYGATWDTAVEDLVDMTQDHWNEFSAFDESQPMYDPNQVEYYRSNFRETFSQAYGYAYHNGQPTCTYSVGACTKALQGFFVAPGSLHVDPAPGDGGGNPPRATVIGYYLGDHGGIAAPSGYLCSYDSMHFLFTPPSGRIPVPGPVCPPLVEDTGFAVAGPHVDIQVGTCHALIEPPVIPGECPSCVTGCPSTPWAPNGGCPSCGEGGRLGFTLDREDLTVRAKDTPISINTHNGPELAVRLSYTGDPNVSGDFGRGWTWNYAMRVSSYGAIRIVGGPSGKGGWWFIPNGDGTYDGPPSSGYILADNAGGWTMTTDEGAQYAFASDGRLLSVTNRFGQAVTLSYDANSRVQSIHSADGVTLTFSRDAQGRVTQIASPDGRFATFAYGKAFPETGVTRDESFLVTAIDMGGVESAYEYDWSNVPVDGVANSGALRRLRRQIVRDVGGAIVQAKDTSFAYATSEVDGLRELTVTDPAANQTLYRLDTMGGETVFTEVSPSGGTTTEQYELRSGRRILLARIDALGNEWIYTYDTGGFLLTETDPLNRTTTYTRNAMGQVLTETRPGGAVTTYTYGANSRDLLTRADPDGAVTTYTYSAEGQVLTVTRSATGLPSEVTIYTYDAQGRRLTETDPTGRTTTNTYDTAGHLVSVAVSGAGTTSYTYNTRGFAGTMTTPDGVVVTRTYDNLDRVVQETWSTDSTSVVTTYGCCGVEQRTSRTGTITNFEYDPNGRLAAEIDHFGNRTEYEYDGNGNRTVVRDALDSETVTAYDLLNRPALVTYPDGTTEATVYDALGRQTRHTDRAGRTQITSHDTAGNVVSTQLEVPVGQGTQTVTLSSSTYDTAGRVLTSTNADGLTLTHTYDAFGRQVQTIWPDQTFTATTYGPAGVLTQTDRLGNTTTYAYDTFGRLLSVTAPLATTGAPQAVTSYAYDAIGRRASVTDPLGRVTSFAYDQEGRATTVTYPGNATETTVYAAGGLVQSRTDRSGVTTTATYDAMGRVLTQSVGGAVVSAVTYDALGRAATQTDARGVTVTLSYDSMGRVVRTTMPDSTHEDMTYGPNGVLTRTDRGGAVTAYTYDAFGRKASETNPNNEIIAYEYDASGRMTALIDANGSRTQWAYDSEGRLITKTYADASTYSYTYDAGGRLLTRTDAKGVTTAYIYDALGRLLTVGYPNDPDVTYTYDLLGRRLTMTDAAGTAAWTYDPVTGQPATADGPFDNDTLAYTWDASGRRTGTTLSDDPNAGGALRASISYTYDPLGHMATVTSPTPDSGLGTPDSWTYSYLGASHQVASLAMPGDVTTTKTYDPLGRLATVTNSGPGAAPASTISSFAYTVDAHDRRTRVDLADGAAGPEPVEWGHWDYTYDAAGQLTGGTRYGPKLDQQEGTLVQYAYQYDAMGNPTHRSEDAGVSAYTYNNLNQLVTGNWSGTLSAFGWTGTSGLSGVSVAAGQQQQAATVFQNGDWTAKGLAVPAGDTTLTVTRTAADQTTAQAQSTVTRPAAATQFTHDLNGNMLGEGQWQYTWDDENRLAAVTPTGATAASRPRLEYVYDGLGRRRIRRVFRFVVPPLGGPGSWQLQSETRFLWDSWLLLRETTVTPADGQTFTRTYTCGLDLSGQLGGEGMDAMATAGGIGGILACSSPSCPSSSSSTACFLYDGNGNVANLVDAESAAALAAYEYSPFGNTVVALGPLADTNPIRFSSKYAETTHLPGLTAGPDLYYYGFRYYSPGLGRWVSRDPIGESGGPGLYLPGHNSVVRDVDPLGEVTLRANGVSAGVPFRPGPGAVFSSGLFPPIPLFGPCAAQYQNVTARILLLNALSSPGLVDAGPPMYGSSWPHQHCVWNCRMTRRVGGVYAYVMSELKEQLDNAWCDLRDLSQSCGDYCGFDRWFRRHLHNQCNSASQPCDYRDNRTGRDCGRQILRCGGDRNWRGDAACEDCCTRRGVGPGTEEGGGTIRPFGPRSRRSPCPGDDAVHGFRL